MAIRKPILFHVSSLPSYKLLRQFAGYCVAAGRDVRLWYEGSDAAVLRHLADDAERAGIRGDVLDPSTASPDTVHERAVRRVHPRLALEALLADEERLTRLLSRVMPAARAASIAKRSVARSGLGALAVHRRGFAAQLGHAFAELARVDPAALVVSEDGISGAMPVLAAARKSSIPIVDIPYGFGVRRDLEIDLGNKKARGEMITLDASSAAGRLLRQVAPQW